MELDYLDALDRQAVSAVASQTYALWGGNRPVERYTSDTLEQLDRAQGLMRFVALAQHGRAVCSLKRYDTELATPRGPLRAVGIGALFTQPAERRRGHAGQLLRLVMEGARAQGYGAALLYSDIDPRYYERLGFVLLPHPIWSTEALALPDGAPLDAVPTSDVSLLLRLHEESFTGGWVRMRRSETSWRLAAWRQESAETLLLVESGCPVGYLIATRHNDILWIADVALPRAPLDKLWSSLRALAASRSTKRVAGWLRPDHARPFAASARSCCIPMIAPLDERLANVAALPSHLAAFDHF